MKVNLVCDVHFFGADPLKLKFRDVINLPRENTFLLGDIVDRKNCRKEDSLDTDLAHSALVAKFREQYISGNHESLNDTDRLFVFNAENGFMHGDEIIYGAFKSWEARSKGVTAGTFMRALKWAFSESRSIVLFNAEKTKKSKTVIDELEKIAAGFPNMKRVFIGHCHIAKITTVKYALSSKEFEIVFLPRGINVVEMDDFK